MPRHIRARAFLLNGEYKPKPGDHPDLPLCGAGPVPDSDLTVHHSDVTCPACDKEAARRDWKK
jgi:hypothetical protein